ncbi:DUF742 domain-containing protein [Streptomyces sp. NPDC057302]|uniref:DUF742 domain-containing protein n=1 Tax=Streptomyces sp. NPDC057302 TaxID=3346094 RepID=UPI00363FA69E
MSGHTAAQGAGDGLGPLRPYLLVRGRSEPSRDLDRTTLVVIATVGAPHAAPQPYYLPILETCRLGACSLAQIAGTIGQPLQVVKIMVCDLMDDGYLATPMPAGLRDPSEAGKDPRILEDVLNGLRNLP